MSVDTESVELVGEATTENVARAALFAALVGAMAQVSFPHPLSPGIPITLQVLGVFLAGIYLGPLWGAASLTLYLAAGAAGVPVFAGGSAGAGILLGDTGGYLLSYPLAAALVGAVVHGRGGFVDPDGVSPVRLVAAMALGTLVIYGLGSAGYALSKGVSLWAAVTVASLPFVPAEVVKVGAALGVVYSDRVAVR